VDLFPTPEDDTVTDVAMTPDHRATGNPAWARGDSDRLARVGQLLRDGRPQGALSPLGSDESPSARNARGVCLMRLGRRARRSTPSAGGGDLEDRRAGTHGPRGAAARKLGSGRLTSGCPEPPPPRRGSGGGGVVHNIDPILT